MKRYYKLFFILLMSSLVFVACNKDEGPAEPTGDGTTDGTTNPTGQPLPSFEGEDFAGVMVAIQYGYSFGGFDMNLAMGFASFGGADGGNVSVNGNTLTKNSSDGSTYYMAPDFATDPPATLDGVSFNGSAHNWSVSGNGDIPSMSGSVISPSTFTINSPASGVTVSKADGLNITWNSTGGTAKVLISVIPMSGGDPVIVQDLENDGDHTLSASELGSISGETMIQVVKYTYNTADAGGKTYVMIAEIVKSVTVTVN
ncbi:MAG: hypothetical protein K9J16_10465 [Melioribacteraceae bacterium]|nr:hypothetical protein [Melioribacteraceae bacterium]MCF8354981.1 hypothetical protein [Melioribacteraceae bacterium]MCF8394002.1 hypothetical protein [Melioribacteraceae bacterium]MCF8419795.1 hypothetical protein [Melioribacteraceae bacterium]